MPYIEALHSFCFSYNNLYEWEDYYEIDKLEGNHEIFEALELDSKNKTLILKSDNVYIHLCSFEGLSTETDAGAILYEMHFGNLLIESSYFSNCSAVHDTSCIRVSSGNSVLASVSAINCHAGNNDGFCSIYGDSDRNIDSFVDSSIFKCNAEVMLTTYFWFGAVNITTVNISNCCTGSYSAIACGPNIALQEDYGTVISYSSIVNNSAGVYCLFFDNHASNLQHQIQISNIIENKGNFTLITAGNTSIYESCLVENGDSYFYTYSNSKFILINCGVDCLLETGEGLLVTSGTFTHDECILIQTVNPNRKIFQHFFFSPILSNFRFIFLFLLYS